MVSMSSVGNFTDKGDPIECKSSIGPAHQMRALVERWRPGNDRSASLSNPQTSGHWKKARATSLGTDS